MNYYKELLKLKDIHGQEVYLYSTIDINHNDIFGLANVVDEFKSSLSDYQKWALHFNKEDAKAMAEALLDRIKELEKSDNKNDDDKAIDLEKRYNELSIRVSRSFDIIVSLEKRIESLELALRSLSAHPDDKNNDREYIEKMKAVAKRYEDMYHRYFNLLYGEK